MQNKKYSKINPGVDWVGVSLSIGLAVLIIIALFSFVTLRQEGAKCIANPPQYAVDKFSDQSGEIVMASFTSKSHSETYTSSERTRN